MFTSELLLDHAKKEIKIGGKGGKKRASVVQCKSLLKIAARKLNQLDSVAVLHELRIPLGNKLETLARDRTGQHSIRINDQYRICFKWSDLGPDQFKIVDYH